MQKRWEVGSEFDWVNDKLVTSATTTLLPEEYELFSTGTSVLVAIANLLQHETAQRLRLHVPSFFCMDVVAKIRNYFDIVWYRDLPTDKYPDFNSLNTLPGDLVLAVNLFGLRDGKFWQDWLLQHDNITLIEDHSHDPFSPWAQQSNAHYAMASLRKTLPIPDGAIIWSGQNVKLPKASLHESLGAYKRLTAMVLKQAYLSGANIPKKTYLQLEGESEDYFDDTDKSAVSVFTANILKSLDIAELRKIREINVRHLLKCISTAMNSDCKPIFNSWTKNHVPFNCIIACRTKEIRDELRKYLISHNIFPPIHWQQPKNQVSSNDELAIDLSNRILTIPTDQRYSLEDVSLVAKIILEFSPKKNQGSSSKSNYLR
jgi:hypothetical protein